MTEESLPVEVATPSDTAIAEFKPEIKHEILQAEYKRRNDGSWSKILCMRIERALSWLEHAEKCVSERDWDIAFISYWISYNALYANYELRTKNDEEAVQKKFNEDILKYERGKNLFEVHKMLVKKREVVEGIVRHPLLCQSHWEHLHSKKYGGKEKGGGWKDDLKNDNTGLSSNYDRLADGIHDTDAGREILSLLFGRIYVLRNQMIHGGARHGGEVNVSQVARCTKIMVFLIPLFIRTMMENPKPPKDGWGKPYSPIIRTGDGESWHIVWEEQLYLIHI
ncbi:MAG: HEPN domain-containing protein, partial [Alphaproteobacteria bacterium]|nr:HEPN domain-containing protein [Alphaproteobacteria bacterium]